MERQRSLRQIHAMKKLRNALLMIAILLLVPPVVFFSVAIFSGISLSQSLQFVLEQYLVRKQNLLLSGIISCVPLLFLGLVLWLISRYAKNDKLLNSLSFGGFCGIFIVSVWINIEFWPNYLPSRVYPGFPHGLEFVIGPLFFAPIAMGLGMVIAWVLTRKPEQR